MKRVIWIVLDSVGAGALPDAAQYGDEGSNTLGHIIEKVNPEMPRMADLGLGLIPNVGGALPKEGSVGAYGRAIEVSAGKDTTTGHWEMSGLRVEQAFPTYPNGFSPELIKRFEDAIGTKVIGNKPASGTAILDELGEEHLRTGYPIVYTSADSVFQIACSEKLYPPKKLYELCTIARGMLQGRDGVGRVIARPFVGEKAGCFTRTGNRRDFSLVPGHTVLNALQDAGYDTIGIGKIEDIFAHSGLTDSDHASGNPACIDAALATMDRGFNGLLFVNLVDFDSAYGHRRDVQGYGDALAYFDSRLPEFYQRMTEDDLLILTADHGCDPTFMKTTDHTREYVPILCYSKKMTKRSDIGTRATYADMAATVAEYFGLAERFDATSFLSMLGI